MGSSARVRRLFAIGGDPGGSAAEMPAADTATVYSLAVDPKDGTLLLSAGAALSRLPATGGDAEPITATINTGGAEGPVTDLVLRFDASGMLFASGHAAPPLPQNLGLMRSSDGGKSWESVSGLDDADYHEIELAGQRVLALRADRPEVQVSDDGGKTFETRDPPADSPPIDVTVNPRKPQEWAVSSEQGVFISTNDGGSWRQRDVTFGPRLVWAKADALISIGRDGKVRRSPDSGRSWEELGGLPTGPRELTAGPDGELYAVLPGGELVRSADTGANWMTIGKAG